MMKKRGKRASYTVEASCVMAVTLMSLAMLIGTAYRRSREETGIMRLHHLVELVRGQEEEKEMDIAGTAWKGSVRRESSGGAGSVRGDGWGKEIEIHAHEPENMMRMLTIFDHLEERFGGNESDGGE